MWICQNYSTTTVVLLSLGLQRWRKFVQLLLLLDHSQVYYRNTSVVVSDYCNSHSDWSAYYHLKNYQGCSTSVDLEKLSTLQNHFSVVYYCSCTIIVSLVLLQLVLVLSTHQKSMWSTLLVLLLGSTSQWSDFTTVVLVWHSYFPSFAYLRLNFVCSANSTRSSRVTN